MSLHSITEVRITDDVVLGRGDLVLIAGPCVIESETHARELGRRIASVARKARLPYVFKASFDKANRTSASSYRGPGMEEGLAILGRIRKDLGVPVLTDIHETWQAEPASKVADVLQIPAFLSRQTDLIAAAAATGRAVNIKKGQFLAPLDMKHALGKVTGAGRVFLTERGSSFGYNNLVVDMRSFPMMRSLGCPVVFDVTHSLQLPGGGNGVSSGLSQYIEPLASAGVAAGVDGVFLEVHEDPSRALSDGPNALPFDRLEPLLDRLVKIHELVESSPMNESSNNPPDVARKVFETEAKAILGLIPKLDENFNKAIDLLERCKGRVIVTGMGKSGIIARKLAATLSSTGTPALFLHAAEAVHGDLGVVQTDDVVVALSYSGETEELIRLLEAIRRIGARLVAMTGVPKSTLGHAADATLNCEVAEEACLMNLAPTASTTASLAMGDALAIALSRRKGFSEHEFANLHPAGLIGKRLIRVEALMNSGDALPSVRLDTPMPDVIHEMSRKRLGMTCVLDNDGYLQGIVTDGDLRRHMTPGTNLLERRARDVMTATPITIGRDVLAVEALRVMEQRRITAVVVLGPHGAVEGVVHLHDLWRTQMV